MDGGSGLGQPRVAGRDSLGDSSVLGRCGSEAADVVRRQTPDPHQVDAEAPHGLSQV